MLRYKWIIGCLLVIASLAYHGCATIIQSNCALETYEGTYAGRYNVGGLIPIPIEDTISITVDLESNQASLSSVLLDTTFVTDYFEDASELRIGALSIPVFKFGTSEFYDVSVQDGYAILDGNCDQLFIQMNSVSVQDHNLLGIPKPINNLDLTSPNFMRRLN
ncbi:MAG: hypothetical protein GY751_07995 [Bacteroidetes bacterium]|nr:hypothetical protein [Bacteroidota bacterium]